MYIPEYLLNGVLPSYLLQRYQFWLDTRNGDGAERGATGGNHELVGYPKPDTSVEDQGGKPSMLRIAMCTAADGTPDPQQSVATIRRFWTEYSSSHVSTNKKSPRPSATRKPRSSASSIGEGAAVIHHHHEKLVSVGKPMTLLNPLSNINGSPLQRLAALLTRIEDLSHVLVWTTEDVSAATASSSVVTIEQVSSQQRLFVHSPCDLLCMLVQVELPRLNLSFEVKEVKTSLGHKSRVLACRQLDGMFISSDVPEAVRNLITGIPECILLENKDEEYFLLISAVGSPQRPPKQLDADSADTDIAFDRTDEDWLDTFSTPPYFIYPIHLSRMFLSAPTLAAALYLVLVHFLDHQYEMVFQHALSCVTDVKMQPHEREIWNRICRVRVVECMCVFCCWHIFLTAVSLDVL